MDDLFGDLDDPSPPISLDDALGSMSQPSSAKASPEKEDIGMFNGAPSQSVPGGTTNGPATNGTVAASKPVPVARPILNGTGKATSPVKTAQTSPPKKQGNGSSSITMHTLHHSSHLSSQASSPLSSSPSSSLSSLSSSPSSSSSSLARPANPTNPTTPPLTITSGKIEAADGDLVAQLQAEREKSMKLNAQNQLLESKLLMAQKKVDTIQREAAARQQAEISKLKATFSQWAAKKKTEFVTYQNKLSSAVTKGRELVTENAKLKSSLAIMRREKSELEEQVKHLGGQVEATKTSIEAEKTAEAQLKSNYESELTELADALLQANQALSLYEAQEEVKRNVNVQIVPNSQPVTDNPLKVDASIEGEFTVRWLRSFRGSNWQKIDGALGTQKTYHPTADDIGATLRCEIVTETGVILGAETGPVLCNPKLLTEVEKLLNPARIKEHSFSVQSLGNNTVKDAKKEALTLNKEKIKLRANNKTWAKAGYNEQLKVTIDGNTRRAFGLMLGSKAEPAEEARQQNFTANSAMERDLIVLSIRLANYVILAGKNRKADGTYALEAIVNEVTDPSSKNAVDSLTLVARHHDNDIPNALEASISRNRSRVRGGSNALSLAQRRTSFSAGLPPGSVNGSKTIESMLNKSQDEEDEDGNYSIPSGQFVVEAVKKTKEEEEEEARKKGKEGVSASAWADIGGGADHDEAWSDDEDAEGAKAKIKVTIDMSKEVKKASGEELKSMALGATSLSLAAGAKKKKKKKGGKKGAAASSPQKEESGTDTATSATPSPTALVSSPDSANASPAIVVSSPEKKSDTVLPEIAPDSPGTSNTTVNLFSISPNMKTTNEPSPSPSPTNKEKEKEKADKDVPMLSLFSPSPMKKGPTQAMGKIKISPLPAIAASQETEDASPPAGINDAPLASMFATSPQKEEKVETVAPPALAAAPAGLAVTGPKGLGDIKVAALVTESVAGNVTGGGGKVDLTVSGEIVIYLSGPVESDDAIFPFRLDKTDGYIFTPSSFVTQTAPGCFQAKLPRQGEKTYTVLTYTGPVNSKPPPFDVEVLWTNAAANTSVEIKYEAKDGSTLKNVKLMCAVKPTDCGLTLTSSEPRCVFAAAAQKIGWMIPAIPSDGHGNKGSLKADFAHQGYTTPVPWNVAWEATTNTTISGMNLVGPDGKVKYVVKTGGKYSVLPSSH